MKYIEILKKRTFPNWHIWIEAIKDHDYKMIQKPIQIPIGDDCREYFCVCCKIPIRVLKFERFNEDQLPICPICYTQWIRWLNGNAL